LRHARLAVHAAVALAMFLFETFQVKDVPLDEDIQW
jgi:hypothetical protein